MKKATTNKSPAMALSITQPGKTDGGPALPVHQVIKQVRERFIPITQAHVVLCLNEQYARRKVLDSGVPEQDYFEVFGRYFVDVEFLDRLRHDMMS